MFQSIKYIGGIGSKYCYQIVDSDFIIQFESNSVLGAGSSQLALVQYAAITAQAISKEYKKRNLSIISPIVRYYKQIISSTTLTLQQIVSISRHAYPDRSEEFYGKYLKHLCRSLI